MAVTTAVSVGNDVAVWGGVPVGSGGTVGKAVSVGTGVSVGIGVLVGVAGGVGTGVSVGAGADGDDALVIGADARDRSTVAVGDSGLSDSGAAGVDAEIFGVQPTNRRISSTDIHRHTRIATS
ncbi:MAG: hypothetical protein M3220_08085 [Chloroflexota bacterium]|nr:hypothetical protein [Chloroflexota bacterium]